jgi:hypothetical protein
LPKVNRHQKDLALAHSAPLTLRAVSSGTLPRRGGPGLKSRYFQILARGPRGGVRLCVRACAPQRTTVFRQCQLEIRLPLRGSAVPLSQLWPVARLRKQNSNGRVVACGCGCTPPPPPACSGEGRCSASGISVFKARLAEWNHSVPSTSIERCRYCLPGEHLICQ